MQYIVSQYSHKLINILQLRANPSYKSCALARGSRVRRSQRVAADTMSLRKEKDVMLNSISQLPAYATMSSCSKFRGQAHKFGCR